MDWLLSFITNNLVIGLATIISFALGILMLWNDKEKRKIEDERQNDIFDTLSDIYQQTEDHKKELREIHRLQKRESREIHQLQERHLFYKKIFIVSLGVLMLIVLYRLYPADAHNRDKTETENTLADSSRITRHGEISTDTVQIRQPDPITPTPDELRKKQFSSGKEQLNNTYEFNRGVNSLCELASTYPNEYLDSVCNIFCLYIRTTTNKPEYKEKYKKEPSVEVQTIIDSLFFKKNENGDLLFDNCSKNLEKTFLYGVNFIIQNSSDTIFMTISNVDFGNAILSKVNFYRATLSKINFANAKLLDSVDFSLATLSKVNFYSATLSKINFTCTILDSINFTSAILLDSTKFSRATLDLVDFSRATLSKVFFWKAVKLNKINFEFAKLSDVSFNAVENLNDINFKGTLLEGRSYEEITRQGRSLELTKIKDNE